MTDNQIQQKEDAGLSIQGVGAGLQYHSYSSPATPMIIISLSGITALVILAIFVHPFFSIPTLLLIGHCYHVFSKNFQHDPIKMMSEKHIWQVQQMLLGDSGTGLKAPEGGVLYMPKSKKLPSEKGNLS